MAEERVRLLFVCSGNICRSPLAQVMAHAALREAELDAVVESCGTAAIDGLSAEAGARRQAESLGLSLEAHRAQPVTRELIANASLVVCVTDRHRDYLHRFFPEAKAKIVSFDGVTGMGDIPDPYGGSESDYRDVREQLAKGMPKIVAALTGQKGRSHRRKRT
jgi:protein arginine phosphatase